MRSSKTSHSIHVGDCLELMKELPDNSVDLILCDLPYGTTQNKWDSVIDLEALWAEYKRICRGTIVLTASQPFTSALVMSNPAWFRHEWVWEKNKASGHLNAKRRPMRAHEDVLVFSKSAPLYTPQMTAGHRPGNYAKRGRQSTCYGAAASTEYGGTTLRYPRSVQRFNVVNNDDACRAHPTQKPIELMEYMIRTYTNPGDVVLDNCMGSGTTGVACMNTGRRFIGMELDEGYFEIAKKRIEDAALRIAPAVNDNEPPSDEEWGTMVAELIGQIQQSA